MIVADLVWSKKNVWEYVKHHTFKKLKSFKILLFLYFAIAILSVVMFFIFREPVIIIIILTFFGILGLYGLFFFYLMKSLAKKIYDANIQNEDLQLSFGSDLILINKKNGTPISSLKWESLSEYHCTNEYLFIICKENSLMIIENKYIVQGSFQDLIKMIEDRNIGKEKG